MIGRMFAAAAVLTASLALAYEDHVPSGQDFLKHIDGDRAPEWSIHLNLFGAFASIRTLMSVPYPTVRDPWVRIWTNLPDGYAEQHCPGCKPNRPHYVTDTPHGHEIWLPEDIGLDRFIEVIVWFYQKTHKMMTDDQLDSSFAERERRFFYQKWVETPSYTTGGGL